MNEVASDWGKTPSGCTHSHTHTCKLTYMHYAHEGENKPVGSVCTGNPFTGEAGPGRLGTTWLAQPDRQALNSSAHLPHCSVVPSSRATCCTWEQQVPKRVTKDTSAGRDLGELERCQVGADQCFRVLRESRCKSFCKSHLAHIRFHGHCSGIVQRAGTGRLAGRPGLSSLHSALEHLAE